MTVQLTKLLALNDPDAGDVEQMRAPTHACIIPASSGFVLPNFIVPAPFMGAAMQWYSWTNNRQPVFLARLAGPHFQRGFCI
jgi:hypothetical protein